MALSNRERSEFGARLRQARIAAGFTQKQVHSALGIAQSTLAELESTATRSGYIAQLASLYGVEANWLATGAGEPGAASTTRPSRILTNEGASSAEVAHGMSLDIHTVPRTLKWEELMTVKKLPATFRLVMRDNAMAPIAGAGATVEFTRASEGQFGDAVLVKDAQGRHYFREMCELADGWEARPTNPAFARLNSIEHGLTVIAVFAGVAKMGSWSELNR